MVDSEKVMEHLKDLRSFAEDSDIGNWNAYLELSDLIRSINMKCKNCKWYDDDTNTCNHPASPKSYEDVGPEDGCETGSLNMATKDKPYKVTTILKVVITGKFRDDESFEETVRYYAEQALEDAGFDVDVSIMRK